MKPPAGRRTLAWSDDERAATMFVRGGIDRLEQRVEDSKSTVRAVEQTAKDVASGKVKLTTMGLTRISGHPTSADEIVRKEASNGSSKVQSGIQS